jgi:type VI secretion system protein ImpH
MHFFRFCELLERSAPDRPRIGTTDSPADEPVRFRSRFQLGFPGREIDTVECDPEDRELPPSVRTTFLSLYGVDARMPSYFIDEIAQHREGAGPLAAFLDIFHHRVITQYYRIWRKYRYPVGFERDGSDPISSYLLTLAGLGLGGRDIRETVGVRKLLSMLGLVNQRTRTAEGLAGVLQHAVPEATITVNEFHPIWVTIDNAQPMPLGEYCVLGGGFFDRGNCVRVAIAPTSRDSVTNLMPGRPVHRDIMTLLRFYLGYESQAVIEMHVHPDLMPSLKLEPNTASLGYTTMLAHDETSTYRVPICVGLGTWNIPSRL